MIQNPKLMMLLKLIRQIDINTNIFSLKQGGGYILNNFPLYLFIYMEIMKIFSDVEGTEKLYSVLMNEEELALFSEVKEEAEKKKQ